MTPKPPLTLTHEDKQTPLWHKLLTHWEDKLASLRTQNDGDKTEIETARLRGQIVAVKACLALDIAPPDLEAPPR